MQKLTPTLIIIIIIKKQQQYHLMYIHTIFPVSNEGFEGDKSTSGPHLPITIPSTVVLCNLKRRGGREEDTIVLADAHALFNEWVFVSSCRHDHIVEYLF
jgi:hypothetical protein